MTRAATQEERWGHDRDLAKHEPRPGDRADVISAPDTEIPNRTRYLITGASAQDVDAAKYLIIAGFRDRPIEYGFGPAERVGPYRFRAEGYSDFGRIS